MRAGIRSNGKPKLRAIDDFSRSGVNECTQPTEKLRCDTLDNLYKMLCVMSPKLQVRTSFVRIAPMYIIILMQGKLCLWKADITSAFRIIPIKATHREYAAVVFRLNGMNYISVSVS